MTTKPSDFRFDNDRVTLPDGWYVRFKSEYDQDSGPPWKDCAGHGPVTDWVHRDKYSGERVLCLDHGSKRYYDFAGAMKIAKRDGWGLNDAKLAKLTTRLGRAPTKGQITEAAVEHDFQYLKDWCEDKWHYIGVIVTLFDADGEEQDSDSIWGVEDYGSHYQELASELADGLIHKHELDVREDADFASRC
jgi:hypothetical protein